MNRLKSALIAVSNVRGPMAPIAGAVALAVVSLYVLGWIFTPGPLDPLVQWLCLGALLAGLVTLSGRLLNAVNLHSRYDPLTIAGATLTLVLSAWCLWREPSLGLLARLSLPLLVVGLAAFYDLWFSVIPRRQWASRLRPGDRFPDFALPDSRNEVTTLQDVVARGPALLVFYKGDW
jgi:hypothetical protein